MIEGPSGAGKSSLAMGLLEAARQRNIDHGFICDDRACLNVHKGELWASSPASIAGKIEIHGYGITNIPYVENAKISLVCIMVTQDRIVRHPDTTLCRRQGINIASIKIPRQHEAQSIRIILAKLDIPL